MYVRPYRSFYMLLLLVEADNVETLYLLFLYPTFSQPTCDVLKSIHDEIWPDPWLFLLIDRRKSVRSFKVIEDVGTQDPNEAPASQTATMTGSQFSQDVMHAVAEKNEQSVPSRSGEAISDVSGKEG